MKHRFLSLVCLLLLAVTATAQTGNPRKMSAFVRALMLQQSHWPAAWKAPRLGPQPETELCAFVECKDNADEVFRSNGCRILAREGDIYIVSLPIRSINRLSLLPQVTRIEAGRGTQALLDSSAVVVNAQRVWTGEAPLPQAYDGTGVVVGVQDIGFDLTHPTYYSTDLSRYRIRRLWDMLSRDTLNSQLYVGRDYTTEAELLALGHSYDGRQEAHGTHTSGIAAGSGYNTPYRGMASGADICLVANGTSNNVNLIDSLQRNKFTYALDALGFKYITDYAKSTGQPSVISFSEGSPEDFRGDDRLYYSFLDALISPGHLIVASAGNMGESKGYFHKPQGLESMGAMMRARSTVAYFAVKCNQDYDLRLVTYPGTAAPDTISLPSRSALEAPDSIRMDTFQLGSHRFIVETMAYQNVWDSTQTVYEYTMIADYNIGFSESLSIEIVGRDADAEFYNPSLTIWSDPTHPDLNAGEQRYTMYSPSTAPNVISVGATSNRSIVYNTTGLGMPSPWGADGKRATYSSIGPSYYGATKPDVVAPGTLIISSYNSYRYEADSTDVHFYYMADRAQLNGRTYPWVADSGTSMSAPMVAGCLALWLQAKPDLTVDEVRSVLAKTCSHPDSTLAYPNNEYGYGEIDTYRGLCEILGLSEIKGISQHQPSSLKITVNANKYLVLRSSEPTKSVLSVTVYSVNGSKLLRKALPAGRSTYSIPLTGLPQGVYAVQVSSKQKSATGSTLFRLR